MCAVFGVIKKSGEGIPAIHLKKIVEQNIDRGPHAFGFAWIDGQGRIKSYRKAGNLAKEIGLLAMAAREAVMLIGHLRWATHGKPSDNINNHPHPADGGWIVHNGIITDYEEILYTTGLPTVSECDSEVIGLLMEREDGKLPDRCKAAIDTTEGPLVMLGLWSRPNQMIVARRGNPLCWSQMREDLYFATDGKGLPGEVALVPENRLYRIGAGVKLGPELELRPSESTWCLRDGKYAGG